MRKRGIKDEQGVVLGSLVVPVGETGTFCDFVQKALPVIPDQPCHSDCPDLAHGLLTPVNIVASCFIRVFIGC